MEKGEALAVLHANDRGNMEEAARRYLNAVTITENAPEKGELIKQIIR